MMRVLVVLGRELRTTFESPVAYVTIGLFVLIQAALFFFVGYPVGRVPMPGLWEGGEASLVVLFTWLPLLLAVLVPALTMGAWAEERRAGTETLLFSYPLRPVEVVLGKFLAAWGLLVLLLSVTVVPVAISVSLLGPLDTGVVLCGLLGGILLAAAYAALSLWVSATSDEPLVAFLLGVLLLGLLWGARLLAFSLPASVAPFLLQASPTTHFLEGFARGVLDLRDVAHFAILTTLGLYLNVAAVSRRTLGPAPGGEYARTRRRLLGNAWLGTLLVLGISIEAGVLVDRHLQLRRDASEDGLYVLSPATHTILGRLDGTLQVKAYFSGNLQSGALKLAKARVEGMLDELVEAGDGRVRLDHVDPAERADVLAEAEQYGIRPRRFEDQVGTLSRSESVFLGLVMRYRSREAVLPFVTPRDLEVQFATRVQALLRERAPVVAWHGGSGGPGAAQFRGAAALLRAQGYELRELVSAADWQAPADLFVVLAPRALGEVELTALEAHVRSGGNALLGLDEVHVEVDPSGVPVARTQSTGLDPLLHAFGVSLFDHHVWDDPWKGTFVDASGRRPIAYPLAVGVRAPGFAGEVPATAGLQRAQLLWAQPVEPVGEPPVGVSRTILLTSSPDAYPIDPIDGPLALDEEVLASKTALQYARGQGRELPLAVLLEGAFPGRQLPPGEASARVVVVGDADWLRDPAVPPFFGPDNRRLFLNLVDWLALDDPALVALRARQPRDRSLRDFDTEERKRLGLLAEESGLGVKALDHDRRLEVRARRSAAWKRWRAMLLPSGLTLALVLAFGIGWNLREGRRPGHRGTGAHA